MAVEGFSCTAFCYGQTTSGKTHTLTGPPDLFLRRPDPTDERHGLIFRSFVYLFQLLREKKDTNFVLKASFLEIYNEKVIDLLNPGTARKPLAVRWSKKSRGFFVENLFTVDCEQLDDLLAVLEEGMRNRSVGSHSMNEHSSRSHTILTVYITSEQQAERGVFLSKQGKLNFVDLAGSEMTKKTNSEGKTLEEANNINKSLMVLGYCISSLSDAKKKHGHIPYRDSKLTKLLADSLAGNGVALMIACISPARSNLSETLSTLRYAARAKKIRTKPLIVMDPREAMILSLKREIDTLQQENEHLRTALYVETEKKFDSKSGSSSASANSTSVSAPIMNLDEKQVTELDGAQLVELVKLYMLENQSLRTENSELYTVRDMVLRDQEIVCRENERLLKKLEDVNSENLHQEESYKMYANNVIIRDGEYTKVIYTLIKEERFHEAIDALNNIEEVSSSRAGLSLLGHCYFQCQDFIEAANCYEHLMAIAPEVPEYRLYFAQCLYQAGLFDEALKVTQLVDAPHLGEKVRQLQSAIRYGNEDYAGAQTLLLQRPAGAEATLSDEGCLLYQASLYEDALQRFTTSLQTGGFNPLVAYNAALCHFRRKENSQALNYIGEIVERGARSVGNPPALAASGLAQALNLKAAIEYQEGNLEGAREALLDLPPRAEPELDPVTLHNMALTDPAGAGAGLRRLAFLMELGPPTCPPETFANILLLCCKHEMYDTAADLLAEHAHLTYRYLTPYLYDLLDALITAQTSSEDAEQKLGTLASNLAGKLRSLAAKVQDARGSGDQNILRSSLREYEAALDNYIPVAMARAWLPWRVDDFAGAEREFRASAEFCSETPIWRLHAAHVLFMRGDKYKEAAAFYEPIVRQNYDDILSVSAAVLANLCVAYIMTSQNEEAEELMRKVERAEERKAPGALAAGNTAPFLHLCIVNLVIGTLYCAKGNYEFGLSRIAHALDGGSGTRLCADTWLHVKRCVLGLLTCLAKQTLVLPTAAVQEVLNFLRTCEIYGISIPSILTNPFDENADQPPTIGIEARKLRVLLLKIMEYH
uniref:Tetratricopeptide repeat protein 30 homolog n=2 Tax=Lutzomyia longipalpis TaxID=7200 RepID=A0A1B0C8F4_LUTLO